MHQWLTFLGLYLGSFSYTSMSLYVAQYQAWNLIIVSVLLETHDNKDLTLPEMKPCGESNTFYNQSH